VVEEVHDRFVEEAVQLARDLRAGEEEGAKLGAMTSPQQVEIVREHIEDALAKGAKAVVGGSHSVRAPFIDPVVLTDVTAEMKIFSEETFGPVLPIARVRSVDEAVERANDSPYGLGSSLWGKTGLRRVADGMTAGATAINATLAFAAIPSLPFGGGGESGFGRIHGDEGLREFCRVKSTAEERFQLPVNMLSFNQPKDGYATNKKLIQQLYGGGMVDRIGSAVRKLKGS
jgi:acyl-CoA reductase-like NAD-dependent aldehyde dehydrogenase